MRQDDNAAIIEEIDKGVLLFGRILLLLLFFGSVVMLILFGPGARGRKTSCFFTRHEKYEMFEARAAPWAPWHIYWSACGGCSNEAVNPEPLFDSKQAAWEFMQKWKLETCK